MPICSSSRTKGASAGTRVESRCFAALLVWALTPAAAADDEDRRSQCGRAYEADIGRYVSFSGAQSSYVPREHSPEAHWGDSPDATRHATQEALSAGGSVTLAAGAVTPRSEDDQDGLEPLFRFGDFQVSNCHEIGGRLWEFDLPLLEYIEDQMAGRGDSIHSANVAALMDVEVWARLGLGAPPHRLRSSLCAPQECEQQEIESEVLPRLIPWMLGLPLLLPPPAAGQSVVQELARWQDLSLDFAVAGLDSCGTTSLQRNLAQHPDIGFTSSEEDFFFNPLAFPERRIIPLRSRVEDFNGRWTPANPRPKLLGIWSASLYRYGAAVQALRRMPPEFRLFVVVCDPVSRLEKTFWGRHCKGRLSTAECLQALAAELHRRGRKFVSEFGASRHLGTLYRMFGPRVVMVHQEALRHFPAQAFDSLAAELGAEPFPSSTELRRHNARPGERTGLCRNATLLRLFKRLALPEYSQLEELFVRAGQRPPAVLRQRVTRCDRPEELAEQHQDM